MSDKKDDKSEAELEREKLTEHRLRMRFQWNDLIEDLIQEGQEQGAFDNLRGQGKPLNLERTPYGAEWELAHKLMKENDVLPPWMVKRNGILKQIETMRVHYGRRWTSHEQAHGLAQGKGHRDALALSWDNVCRQWEDELKRINKQIEDFNLGRPSEGLEIYKLRLDLELERAGSRRWLQ